MPLADRPTYWPYCAVCALSVRPPGLYCGNIYPSCVSKPVGKPLGTRSCRWYGEGQCLCYQMAYLFFTEPTQCPTTCYTAVLYCAAAVQLGLSATTYDGLHHDTSSVYSISRYITPPKPTPSIPDGIRARYESTIVRYTRVHTVVS